MRAAPAGAVRRLGPRLSLCGAPAPGSYAQFSELTKLKEAIGVPPAIEMVEQLVHDQVLVTQSARKVVAASERAGDQASADLGVRRIQTHEKNAWMLRSHLEA